MSNATQNESHSGGKETLRFTFQGKEHFWPTQFITGKQLRDLGSVPAGDEIFLSIKKPWADELILDETKLDLARPEIEHFFVKKKLHFTINKKPFTWEEQYITGKQLRYLGEIDEYDEIMLVIEKPYEDELITDETKVDLARPGVEHFISKEKPVDVTIIVNGTPKKWKDKKITFKEVVILAYGEYIDKPTMVYTVGYEDGPKQNPEGSMIKTSVVFVKNKMIFHATATDKS